MSLTQWGEIKFDAMEVKTDLAQDSISYHAASWYGTFLNDHLIYHIKEIALYRLYGRVPSATASFIWARALTREVKYTLQDKLINLAQLVEQKADLFAQIEFVLRKIPIEEVKAYDIKLIVNNLVNRNHFRDHSIMSRCEVRMHAETPLANIAFVAQCLIKFGKANVYSSKKTAAVSHLFVKLCLEVGFDVELIIVSDEIFNNWDLLCYEPLPEIKSGCVAVVTERSDHDSAVDVLLGTTTRYPWKLSRVLVQESVYARVRRALAARARPPAPVPGLDELKQLSDDVFEGQGKVFLVDYAGEPKSAGADKVFVEAYRTTKELISLLAKHQPHYLSVWSSDLSEANEIAHKTQAPVVWVNGYGIFDGPPQSSQAIYGTLSEDILQEWEPKDLKEIQAKWLAKSFDERQRIACASIMKISPECTLLQVLGEVGNDDFVHVKGDHMCVGLSKPLRYQFFYPGYSLDAVAKSLISGCIVIFLRIEEYEYLDDLDKIIPFCRIKGFAKPGRPREYVNQMKVIWTNFGTIFAN